jgi:predicted transcriptional regulator
MDSDRKQDRHAQGAMVVRLSDDLRARIRQAAEVEERTQTQVIRRALARYLAEEHATA